MKEIEREIRTEESINFELNNLLKQQISIRQEILAATKKLHKLTEELFYVEREHNKYMNIGNADTKQERKQWHND